MQIASLIKCLCIHRSKCFVSIISDGQACFSIINILDYRGKTVAENNKISSGY